MNLEINKRNARVWSMLGMRRVVGQILSVLAEQDSNFVFLTADVARYFGTEEFQKEYPSRIVDVGIAEQNLVTVAAGMTKEGIKAFAATYATFITARALDQIRVSLGYMQLPTVLIGVGGGMAEGDLSATHMGLEDIADIRSIPNITIICPADATEVIKSVQALLQYNKPTYLRLTGKTSIPCIYTEDYQFEIGKAVVLKEGTDVALIGTGCILGNVLKAANKLEEDGISCKVINMHTIKPLDYNALDMVSDFKLLVTVEEHSTAGGLGGAVAEYFASKKSRPQHIIMGLENLYPNAAEYDDLLSVCGLSAEEIVRSVKDNMQSEK